MDIFTFLSEMLTLYGHYNTIHDVLINKTAVLLDKIGHLEFNAAIQCLHNAKYSNNKDREINRAITILINCFEKLNTKDKLKYKSAIIIGVLYNALNEKKLYYKYLNLSRNYFSEWIDSITPSPNPPFPFLGLDKSLNMIKINDFMEEILNCGLQWKGRSGIPNTLPNPLAYTIVLKFLKLQV